MNAIGVKGTYYACGCLVIGFGVRTRCPAHDELKTRDYTAIVDESFLRQFVADGCDSVEDEADTWLREELK